MPHHQVVKGSFGDNPQLRAFAGDLVSCVQAACVEIGATISSEPEAAFGTQTRVTKEGSTAASVAAREFRDAIPASHANAYGRHFMARVGKTVRMDLGNLVEQRAIAHLRAHYPIWREGEHYLYQVSTARAPDFPINFVGTSATARPDVRFRCNGGEAVFDFTTPRQVGHLLTKRIGRSTLGNLASIPVAVEIVWQDSDVHDAARRYPRRTSRAARFSPY